MFVCVCAHACACVSEREITNINIFKKTSTFYEVWERSWYPVLPLIVLERVIHELKPTTCHFWWKALAIAPRPNLLLSPTI